MKKGFFWGVVLLVFGSFPFSGCSKSQEADSDRGAIKQMTDRAADEIVEHIRTPINQARTAKDLGDGHVENMEKEIEALDK